MQIPGAALHQQQKPAGLAITAGCGAGRFQQHVGAENGLDTLAATGAVELDGAKQVVQVGDGQRALAVGPCGGRRRIDAQHAIDDGKLGVRAQMDKAHSGHSRDRIRVRMGTGPTPRIAVATRPATAYAIPQGTPDATAPAPSEPDAHEVARGADRRLASCWAGGGSTSCRPGSPAAERPGVTTPKASCRVLPLPRRAAHPTRMRAAWPASASSRVGCCTPTASARQAAVNSLSAAARSA
jgi:hypothetical protein